MIKYLCRIYEQRAEWCRGYPWGLENDLFAWCQFTKETSNGLELIPEEEVLKVKTREQIQDYCIHCGSCCMFWEGNKVIHHCSALIVEETQNSEEKKDVVRDPEKDI